jgi:Transposase zinc-binding domain
MPRPLLEVADIVRVQGDRFIHSNFRWIHWAHRKVLRAIARCRAASLGGHRDRCPRCGYRAISYNSCRDRHCPKCHSSARDKWIRARQSELLLAAYVHVVFTLPHQLSPLALQNKKVLHDLLFPRQCRDPARGSPQSPPPGSRHWFPFRLAYLGAESARSSSRPLRHSGRGHLARLFPVDSSPLPLLPTRPPTQSRLPRQVRRRFKTSILATPTHLRRISSTPGQRKGLPFLLASLVPSRLGRLRQTTFGGPHHVLGYLAARYTHRVAITNHRLMAFELIRLLSRA